MFISILFVIVCVCIYVVYLSCCLSVATVSWIVESDVKMGRIDKTMEKLREREKRKKNLLTMYIYIFRFYI